MKYIFLIFTLLQISCLQLSAQITWIKIYDAEPNGILRFKHFKYQNSSVKEIYFQYGMEQYPQHSTNSSYYSWCKWDKVNNICVERPHSSFLYSFPFYCPWPQSQGWKYFSVEDFIISSQDQNLILEVRNVPYCGWSINEPQQDTRITYDNGINLRTLENFSNGFMGNVCGGFDFDPLNDTIIYFAYPVIPYPYVIHKSTNRGFTWFITDTVTSWWNGGRTLQINPLKRTNIFLSASYTILKSTSNGYNFYPVDSFTLKKLYFDLVDSSIYGITSFQRNGIIKSTNHGENWTLLRPGYFHTLEINPDDHNIVYAGSDSGLYRSINGGLSWELYNNSFTPSKRVIGISKDPGTGDTVYVITDKAIYKVWDRLVDVNFISTIIPKEFYLYQNYPNPCNPVTKIRFDIRPHLTPLLSKKGATEVVLKIYDILGREVATLVNEQLKPGSYEIEWDGTNYPSGVYYYRLYAGDFNDTRRMVLIK